MRERITELCRVFVAGLMDQDFDRAAEWASPPVSVATCGGQKILRDHAEVADDLRTLWAPYAKSGTVIMRPNVLAIRSFSPGMVQADIEWRMVDGRGTPIRGLFSTYTIRDTPDGLKVVQIVSHNEMLHRPIVA